MKRNKSMRCQVLIICCLKERAENPEDFEDVRAHLEDAPKVPMAQKFPIGSAESEALGVLAVQDEEHYRMPFPDIAKESTITAARSTVENIMHNHHKIFRRKGRERHI